MAKRKKISAEQRAKWARTMRLLEERIAYHERKAAEERAPGAQPQA
jgi:hypothetical protein